MSIEATPVQLVTGMVAIGEQAAAPFRGNEVDGTLVIYAVKVKRLEAEYVRTLCVNTDGTLFTVIKQ